MSAKAFITFAGSTVFRCPLCDVQSGRKDNILRHIRNLHSDENFDEIIKKISKTVARLKIPATVEPETIPDAKTTDKVNVHPTLNVCQYQSVIQFAGRSQTPPQMPMNRNEECSTDIGTPATNDDDDNTDKNVAKPFNNELHVELVEPNESEQKIKNISIYRQLLSPYLRPPPNLDFRNGSEEQEKHRSYQVQGDRLPIRKENVDIYRSILMSTTDAEHQSVIQNKANDVQDNGKLANSKTEPLVIHGQSSEYFSEMHWRKRTSQCFNQMEQ